MQTQLFINGEFVDGRAGATIEVLNPHDNSLIAEVAEARAEDVDRAVEAAKAAFPAWSATPESERGRLLLRLADLIDEHSEELARLESTDTGHPIRDSRALDAPRTAMTFRYFGGMADKVEGRVVPVDAGYLNYVLRKPLGVVGQIVPWNFPLMFTSWKMGPALAAGNTVVMKPAELTPLSSLRIAELMAEAGFPPGVVNIVPGYGRNAGERIALHPDIAKVSFTGSTAVGQRIVEASAGNLKRLQLELGGKGANIVFDDADLDDVLAGTSFAIFHNQGQACIAGSRLLAHEAVYDEVVERLVKVAQSIRLGDPLDDETQMGPLTSAEHRDRVLGYTKVATDEGGEIMTGGRAPTRDDLADGCYVEPTIVAADVDDSVAQQEVFGPFLTVLRFSDEADAVRKANAVQYGLGGGLWTRDLARGHRVAKALRAGMVWINCYKRVHPGSPFGGVGYSGYGREMGFEAMHDYTEAQSIWVNVDAEQPNWYPQALG